MREFSLIINYSWRLLTREWRRFVLPLLSLTVTGVVLVLVLLLTASSSLLLSEQAKDLLGGDAVVESSAPIDIESVWAEAALSPAKETSKIDFTASIQSAAATVPVSFLIVDENYPLNGKISLADRDYTLATDNEIYLDEAASERLQVIQGDKVFFGEVEFEVAGIITAEPNSLFGGFRFLPRVIMSQVGFLRSAVDTNLLRSEYEYAAILNTVPSAEAKEAIGATLTERGLDIDFAGSSRTGLQRGLTQVSEFLIVAVLITSVLAAVNVYASTIYLLTLLRRSFAVLLALGMKRPTLVGVLGLTLLYVVILAGLLGAVFGYASFTFLVDYIATNYAVILPTPNALFYSGLSLVLTLAITIGSFVPAVRSIFSVSPQRILITGETTEGTRIPFKTFFFNSFSTLVPLALLAAFLLNDLGFGFLVILGILSIYIVVAIVFWLILALLYRLRHKFSFLIRSIISQKKADGLFGIVSFTSLFMALVALSTLVLVQVSLERYFVQDLATTIPTTYVLDIQPSQKSEVLTNFPDLVLFANIPARIIDIDGRRIQELLNAGTDEISGELRREFNLTFRKDLLTSESITAGKNEVGIPGEISVDEKFADQAEIELGSQVTFLIQGFEVSGVVTSLRATDSRSGLPFFYFVLAPEDIEQFPSVNFGYSYYEADKQAELARYLATNMPNVSVLQTEAFGPLLVQVTTTLMTLILIIAIPPLLIATLLVATLVVFSYSARRREGARLQALGSTKRKVLLQYLLETVSLTLISAGLAYLLSVVVSYVVSVYYIGVDTAAIFDTELLLGLGLVVALIALLGLYLFKSDTMPLRQLLAYEENH